MKDSATPWTIARQAPLSMGFCRQGYRSGVPFPPPGDLPHPGIESTSPVSPAAAGGFLTAVERRFDLQVPAGQGEVGSRAGRREEEGCRR